MKPVEYRDIPGYPGYRVGDDGSVWFAWRNCCKGRILTDHWKPMKLSAGSRGYLRVNLVPVGGGCYKTFRVHRLVLTVFRGPCPEGCECRHLNGVKTDCSLENLAWGTQERNRQDNHYLGVYASGERHTQAKLTNDQVAEIRARYSSGGVTQQQLADEFGVSNGAISMIVNYKVRTRTA